MLGLAIVSITATLSQIRRCEATTITTSVTRSAFNEDSSKEVTALGSRQRRADMGFVLLGRPAVQSAPVAAGPIRQVTTCLKFKVVKVSPDLPHDPQVSAIAFHNSAVTIAHALYLALQKKNKFRPIKVSSRMKRGPNIYQSTTNCWRAANMSGSNCAAEDAR